MSTVFAALVLIGLTIQHADVYVTALVIATGGMLLCKPVLSHSQMIIPLQMINSFLTIAE